MSAPLYNRAILELAVALAGFPRLSDPALSGEARAPLCGSRVVLDLALDSQKQISAAGLAVEACALGQAAATLFARGAPGRDGTALVKAHRALAAWLSDETANAPDWPGIDVLAPARRYPARHGAILLPFALAATLCGNAAEVRAA